MTMTVQAQTELTKLYEEHRHLEQTLERLRALLSGTPQPATAVSLIDDIHGQLVSHFAHEEKGGYFAELLASKPRLRGEAERLLAHHPELLERLEEVRAEASRATETGDCRTLSAAFDRFFERFEEHEHREESLLQGAHGTDIGATD
jgi:hypothetical protein